ncbi:MAG: PAS domain S-box protein [Bacteroidales bacterium]|nr:PAS domain S-box protein [Bacteroidales bacterium]
MVNKAVSKLFGMQQADLIKRLNSDYVSQKGPSNLLDKTDIDLLTNGQTLSFTERFTDPSGNVYWFHTIKSLLSLNGQNFIQINSTDITSRRKREQVIARNEEFLSALLNANMDFMAMVDIEGRIILINNNGAKRFNKSPEELKGFEVLDFFSDKVAQKQKNAVLTVMETRKPYRFLDERDGNIYDTSIYPIHDESHQVSSFAIYARDITVFKKAEIETRKALVREQELHELKSAVISTLSHEFRTPLAIIQSNLQLLEKFGRKLSDPELKKTYSMVYSST